jgi:hypothetical protein
MTWRSCPASVHAFARGAKPVTWRNDALTGRGTNVASDHLQRAPQAPKTWPDASKGAWSDLGPSPVLTVTARQHYHHYISIRHLWPDVGLARPVTIIVQYPISHRDRALHCYKQSNAPLRVRSLQNQSLVSENSTSSSPTSSPFIKCANHQVFHLVHVY